MEMGDLLTHLPQLSALMEEATVCLPERAAVTSGLVQIAIMLVLKECTMMYKSSEEAMMNIVDKFFSLSPEDATKVLVVYKGNQAAKEKLVQFMEVCKASGLSQVRLLPCPLWGAPVLRLILSVFSVVTDSIRLRGIGWYRLLCCASPLHGRE